MNEPFGIAFYPPGPNPQYVYVGEANQVVRFPYKGGDLRRLAIHESDVAVSASQAIGGAAITAAACAWFESIEPISGPARHRSRTSGSIP